MATLFERLRDTTGLRLLTTYGDIFRITKTNSGTFNASTGTNVVSTATQDIRGKAFSKEIQFDTPELAETADSEIYLTASGLTFNPAAGMLIASPVDSTTPQRIVSAKPIPESGAVVIWLVTAKR